VSVFCAFSFEHYIACAASDTFSFEHYIACAASDTFSFEHYIACAASDMIHVFSLLKVLSIL
jgi:hypothetical protein